MYELKQRREYRKTYRKIYGIKFKPNIFFRKRRIKAIMKAHIEAQKSIVSSPITIIVAIIAVLTSFRDIGYNIILIFCSQL